MGVGVIGPAVPRGAVEVEILDQVDTPDDRRPELPVRGEDPIGLLEGERAADLSGLLADQRWIHGQLTLALERRGLQVGPSGEGHQPKELA